MTREELDFIGAMNMCDEISNAAYKKIVCHCEEQEPCTDAVSRAELIGILKEKIKTHRSTIEIADKLIPLIEQLPSVTPTCEEREKGECPWYAG